MIKWTALVVCMACYGELRVMSFYAAMFGAVIAICALIYAALDIGKNAARQQQKAVRRRRAGYEERR